MNKADIINKVHEALGGTRAEAERAVETVIGSIVSSLKSGSEVSVAGLGIFSAKMRNARTGRNPRTGETIEIPAMRIPKFRAAKALKEAVRNLIEERAKADDIIVIWENNRVMRVPARKYLGK